MTNTSRLREALEYLKEFHWTPKYASAVATVEAALSASPSPAVGPHLIYEAPRDSSHVIRVRGVGRQEDDPRALSLLLTERPTDDEIRALHDFFSQRPMLEALASPSPGDGEAVEAAREWLDCAVVDACMDGPKLKGWSRSALDRLWRKYAALAIRQRGEGVET